MAAKSATRRSSRAPEADVVGKNDDVTGQAIRTFVSVRGGSTDSDALAKELRGQVGKKLGKFNTPKYLALTQELPKTRSGKIMHGFHLYYNKRVRPTKSLTYVI